MTQNTQDSKNSIVAGTATWGPEQPVAPTLPYQGPRFETRDESINPPELAQFETSDDSRSTQQHRRESRREIYDGLREGNVNLGSLLRFGLSSLIVREDESRGGDVHQRSQRPDEEHSYNRDGYRTGPQR